ncbi:MAG: pyridoxal phosphate-dependent aminotransferase [Muribaculaceae bacterium]|nr:pyridoxal phosphate-dependent aminotransferase [Muribaculaceae bacterium]MDE6521553.1 pyridoxal phosphate-dependent aminotransferase [Muribaculaceae bacterium]
MFPLSQDILTRKASELGIIDISTATIRQIVALSAALEKEANEKFVHLELGNPGLPASSIGVEAEITALREGVANTYPAINGIPEIKKAGARFVKAFLNIDIPEKAIVPTVGSMQASFTLQLLLSQRLPGRDTMLFFNPGFPAQRHQAKVLGIGIEQFDIYDYRGKALEAKLEEILSKGNVTGMLFSNPNNPSWINLTEEELEIIGRMATKYDVIVIEDLAYMGMDFRTDFSHPFEAPYIPSVSKYTDNYVILISGSKIFSYAGQRIAVAAMSKYVYDRQYEFFSKFYEMPAFGDAYIFGVLYTASSGTSHAAQYALAAMMDAACDGHLDFVKDTSEYGRRSEIIKKCFTDNGFHIVYDKDGDRPISDGFFFTAGFGNMDGKTLQSELLRHGISSITLSSTGSEQEGVRVCVSTLSSNDDFNVLDQRLKAFQNEH